MGLPIKIRIETKLNEVKAIANHINYALDGEFRVIEQSKVYPNRPPNENRGRVYLIIEETLPKRESPQTTSGKKEG